MLETPAVADKQNHVLGVMLIEVEIFCSLNAIFTGFQPELWRFEVIFPVLDVHGAASSIPASTTKLKVSLTSLSPMTGFFDLCEMINNFENLF